MYLEIDFTNEETVVDSFRTIAKALFSDYVLIVNETRYRLLDLEFYCYAENQFEDPYAHKHNHQLTNGKWYSHGSGLDITFGNGIDHGGILIRAIAEIDKAASKGNLFLKKEVHGPLNVKTEILSNLNGAFSEALNTFYLADISKDKQGALMIEPNYVIETIRIGLNGKNDLSENQKFYKGNFRYVIFPHLKLKNKTQLAIDMKRQFEEMSNEEINKIFGSKFL